MVELPLRDALQLSCRTSSYACHSELAVVVVEPLARPPAIEAKAGRQGGRACNSSSCTGGAQERDSGGGRAS